MKQDSLLSSLSNVSYHANNHMDFFNDSSPAGGYPELKIKQVEQEEVDLNCLPAFSKEEPPSPRPHALLAAYWTAANNMVQGHSDIGQSEMGDEEQQQQMDHHIIKIEPPQCQIQEPMPQQASDSQSAADEQIGTVIKNQTKNIPKNYGKAIITYIEKQRQNFEHILKANGIEYQELLDQLSKKKKYINTIANLRDMWVDFKYARCMRILSNQFLRKYALQYIFNSRICNYTSHVKYRKRLQEAIEQPGTFRHIKQY